MIMELTQEQLDAIVAEAVKKATSGLYTEEDLARKVTSEVDRRVESGIQKGIETQKKKWEEEFAKRAQLTAEELAQKEISEKMSAVEARERELAFKANLIEAKDLLASAEIPKEKYEKLLDTLVLDDSDRTKQNVTKFIEVYVETRNEIETKLKSELTNVKPPSVDDKHVEITKETFDKMSYGDKLKLKTEKPELYKQLIG